MLWQVGNIVIALAITTVLFATIFKVLPDARIAWRDVWVGGLLTAILFTIGKLLLGLYLGRSAIASSYGAAGSLIVLLAWVYYSSQIVFFGAEFTRVYAEREGTHRDVAKPEDPAPAGIKS
jgi:membrane protein